MGILQLGHIGFNRSFGPPPGPSPILWNRLEGESGGVITSNVGPDLLAYPTPGGGSFSSGHYGNALNLTGPGTGVQIPGSLWSDTEGCIEWWAYYTSGQYYGRLLNADIWNGSGPRIFFYGASELGIGFQPMANGAYTYNYSVATGQDDKLNIPLNQWNHIAFSWKRVAGGDADRVWGALNGVVVEFPAPVAGFKFAWDTPSTWPYFGVGYIDAGWAYGPEGQIDNIKMWDYAKLDFSDRNTE